jgi:hypothetical protein
MRDYLAERLAREETREGETGDWAELFTQVQEERAETRLEEMARSQAEAADWLAQRENPETGTGLENLEALAGRVSDLVAEKLTGTAAQPETGTQNPAEGRELANLISKSGEVKDLSRDGNLWVAAETPDTGRGSFSSLGQADITALDRAVEREARRYDGAYRLY